MAFKDEEQYFLLSKLDTKQIFREYIYISSKDVRYSGYLQTTY